MFLLCFSLYKYTPFCGIKAPFEALSLLFFIMANTYPNTTRPQIISPDPSLNPSNPFYIHLNEGPSLIYLCHACLY